MNVIAEVAGSIRESRSQAIESMRERMHVMTDQELVGAAFDANATALLIEAVAAGRSLPPCGLCGEPIDDPRDAQVFKRSSDAAPIIAHTANCFKSELHRIVSIAARPGGHAMFRGLR